MEENFKKTKKLHINDFLAQLTNEELLQSVENELHWQNTGNKLYSYTATDKIGDEYLYFFGANRMDCYDLIAREVAKRVFNKKI